MSGQQRITVLDRAHEATSGDRPASYGRPIDHFERTAGMVNARFAHKLREPFTAEEWAQVMIIDKLARLGGSLKLDTITDIAGYARTLEMVIEDREERRLPERSGL